VYHVDLFHSAAGLRAAHIQHQGLGFHDFLDLVGIGLVVFDAQESPQHMELDLQILIHIRQLTRVAEDLPHQSVGPGQSGVDLEAHADQSAWHRVQQVVLLYN